MRRLKYFGNQLGYAVKPLTQIILREPKTEAQMAVHAEVVTRYDLDAVFMYQARTKLR